MTLAVKGKMPKHKALCSQRPSHPTLGSCWVTQEQVCLHRSASEVT